MVISRRFPHNHRSLLPSYLASSALAMLVSSSHLPSSMGSLVSLCPSRSSSCSSVLSVVLNILLLRFSVVALQCRAFLSPATCLRFRDPCVATLISFSLRFAARHLQSWLRFSRKSGSKSVAVLPALAAGDGERRPRIQSDVAPMCNHLGYAGDLDLVATSPKDIHKLYGDLESACTPKGLTTKPEKLQVWSDFPENPFRAGSHYLKVEVSPSLPLQGSRQRGRAPGKCCGPRFAPSKAAHHSSLEPKLPACSARAPKSCL